MKHLEDLSDKQLLLYSLLPKFAFQIDKTPLVYKVYTAGEDGEWSFVKYKYTMEELVDLVENTGLFDKRKIWQPRQPIFGKYFDGWEKIHNNGRFSNKKAS